MQRILLLCCLLVAMPAAWCLTVKIHTAFDNGAYPAQVKLGELNAEWFQVKMPAVDSFDSTLMLRMMTHGESWGPADLTLTRGQLVSLSGHLYLVVYQLKNNMLLTQEEQNILPPLTMETLLFPSLISLSDLLTLTCAGTFDLEGAIRERKQAIEAHEREMKERAARDAVVAAGVQQGNEEGQLKIALQQMRAAIARFKDDTGAYPAALTDLVLPAEKAPAGGVDANGKPVPIKAGTYAGPYLSYKNGILEAPGIPFNPYVDLRRDDPSPALLATHWQYQNGYVGVPEYLFGILTSDGKMLGEL